MVTHGRSAMAHLGAVIVVAILILIVAFAIIIARTARFFETRTRFAQNAKIMVCELEIIFAHHAIALHLGIARQRLIFFVQLIGVAARAIVDPVAAIISSIHPIRTGPATTTTAAAVVVILTIINHRMSL